MFSASSYNRYNTRIFLASDTVGDSVATGAISEIVSANLPSSKALVSSSGGKITVSSVPSSKIDLLLNLDSDVQEQIDDALDYVVAAKTYSGAQTFISSGIKLQNPGASHVYTFVGANIAADRNITMPLLAGNDVLVTADFIQTLTNKTLGTGSKIIIGSDATGDVYYNGGSGVITRLPKGSANQLLGMNNAATIPEYKTVSNGLTSASGSLKLGGSLTADTTIDGSDFDLSMNTKSFAYFSPTFIGTLSIDDSGVTLGGPVVCLSTLLMGDALTLSVGSSTAGGAPLKFPSGTPLSVTEGGAMEFDGIHLYFTVVNGGTRYQLDRQWATFGTTTLTANATIDLSTFELKIGSSTSQKIGLWNKSPIAQPSGANQVALTDSTGGTPSFTLADVTTGGLADPAKVNNVISSLFRVVNEYRNVLVNTGIMKGAA